MNIFTLHWVNSLHSVSLHFHWFHFMPAFSNLVKFWFCHLFSLVSSTRFIVTIFSISFYWHKECRSNTSQRKLALNYWLERLRYDNRYFSASFSKNTTWKDQNSRRYIKVDSKIKNIVRNVKFHNIWITSIAFFSICHWN